MGLHWLEGDLALPSKRIPLHWAAAILVVFSLPLSFYLDKWNFPSWVSFIVWTERQLKITKRIVISEGSDGRLAFTITGSETSVSLLITGRY